jgi:hypothetical protein
LINPDCKWEFNQILDNDGKGTDDCYEFLGDDESCIQFNIHQPAEDEIRCYLKGNWDDDEIPVDKIEQVNDFLGAETVINKQDTKANSNQIKQHYVLEGEIDKFTKIAEYKMPYPGLTLDSSLITDHVKAESGFGIGSARMRMETIYRHRNEEDILIIKVTLNITSFELNYNQNILKDAKVLFLLDDNETIQTGKVLDYKGGQGPLGMGLEESTYLEADFAFLSKLAFAKKIEYRVSGKRGNVSEGELNKSDLFKLKGFYNSLFDPEFMKDELIEQIEEDLVAERKKEKERKKKEADKQKTEKVASGSSSSCFVITATMGDPYHPIVDEFRAYRDQKLLTNSLGKAFVSFYYKVGPYLASIIGKSEVLRKLSFSIFVNPIYKRLKNDRNTNKN